MVKNMWTHTLVYFWFVAVFHGLDQVLGCTTYNEPGQVEVLLSVLNGHTGRMVR